MLRCSFCPYTTSSLITLFWDDANCRLAQLVQKQPYTSTKAYFALSVGSMQHLPTEVSTNNDENTAKHVARCQPEVPPKKSDVSDPTANPRYVFIDELSSLLDVLARLTGVFISNQLIIFLLRENFDISMF